MIKTLFRPTRIPGGTIKRVTHAALLRRGSSHLLFDDCHLFAGRVYFLKHQVKCVRAYRHCANIV
jgi:hypothetical protein